MASVSGYGGARQPRSGGKMVRPRRTAVARTPYDRPGPGPRNSAQQNPNWFSRLVYNPTRVIAAGAGKFLSSVLFSDSSSSSSSSDADSASDIDADEAMQENNTDSPEDETMQEKNGALEMNEGPVSGLQPMIQRNTTKKVIEQLLMQETFVREECDRLTNIIKARVVVHPTILATEEGRHSGFPNNRFVSDVTVADMPSKAVMEARKWLEEKKSGSGSKFISGCGSPLLDSAVLPHATEDDVGSPVDMAKSYMGARPPWASPSANHVEFQSPSPVGMQLFNDETPFSYSGSHFSSSKLEKGSRSTRSWNIQEEIRKVRAKATEEMLRSVSSPNTDWAAISGESKHGTNVLATDMLQANERGMFWSCANAVDASLNADRGASSSCQVAQNVQEACQNETLPNPATSTSEHNQAVEADQAAEATGVLHTRSSAGDCLEETLSSTRGVKLSEDMNNVLQSGTDAAEVDGKDGDPNRVTGGTTHVVLALGATPASTGNFCVPKDVSGTDQSTSKEDGGTGEPLLSNGFPHSAPSLPAAVDSQPEPCLQAEESNRASSALDEPNNYTNIEEKCQLLTETLVDIPVANGSEALLLDENDSLASASQNSSSTHQEWLPDDLSLPNSTSSSPGNSKVVGYSRRGRGRGRGRSRGRGRGRAKQTTP